MGTLCICDGEAQTLGTNSTLVTEMKEILDMVLQSTRRHLTSHSNVPRMGKHPEYQEQRNRRSRDFVGAIMV
jgi:hypothetical protein